MKRAIRITIILVLIIAAIIGYSMYKKSKNKPDWRMDTVSIGNIREEVTASGTLNATISVEVGTEISGTISRLYKDFNSSVKKGDVLAMLDTENLQTSLETAQTDVERAQTSVNDTRIDLDLQKGLSLKNMGTSYDLQKAQNKYDQAVQSLKSARLAIKRAEKNLQNAIITSPIDGVIVSRNVDEGQTVAASFSSPTLFVIAKDLKQMQITAGIDEADIGKIKVGLPVEFTVDAYSDEQFTGKVNQVRLSPTTTENVVTYNVIIDVSNQELKLLPGMTANVTIIIQEKDDVLRISDSSLRFKPTKEMWKLFGLKWDSSSANRRSISGKGTNGMSTGTKSGESSTHNNANMSQKGGKNMPALSDSQKAAFDKMTPEQRQAMRKKMQHSGGKPDFANMTDEQKAAFRKRMQQNGFVQGRNSHSGNSGLFSGSASEKSQSSAYVYVLKDKVPTKVEVVTGLSDGNYTEIISGLTEGQEIISGVTYKNSKQLSKASSAFSGGGGMMRP